MTDTENNYVYEPFAQTEEYLKVNLEIVREWIEMIKLHAGRPVRTVIDVACGVGTMAQLFLQNLPVEWPRPTVTLVDMSHAAIDQATQRVKPQVPALDSICGPIQSVTLPDQAYDVVLWGNGIHYLTAEEQVEALGRLRSAIRPGGWLLFNSAFTEESRPAETLPFYRAQIAKAVRYLQSIGVRRERNDARPSSSSFLPADHYTRILQQVGFSVQEVHSVAARLYQSAWEHISGFAQYAAGALHGYGEEIAAQAMRMAVAPAIEQYGVRDHENRPYVQRNWLAAAARVDIAPEETPQ
jgi:ubiquinone/menaquinone biosynthesis C-methylase UbiE